MSEAKNDDSGLSALLCANAEIMPMPYARALLPRVNDLLLANVLPDERRQLLAVKDAMENPKLDECRGLDRLHYFLDQLERKYA